MTYCVYTTLFDDYELLNPPPVSTKDFRFICITDNPNQESLGWEFQHPKVIIPGDSKRTQKLAKILGPIDEDHQALIYLDNSVSLKKDAFEVLSKLLETNYKDCGFTLHSYHENLAQEFAAVLMGNRDDSSKIIEQLNVYSIEKPSILSTRVYWGGLFAYRNTHQSKDFRLEWATHVLRFSLRDQLSLAFLMRNSQIDTFIDNFDSEIHTWPIESHRKKSLIPKLNFNVLPPVIIESIKSQQIEVSNVERENFLLLEQLNLYRSSKIIRLYIAIIKKLSSFQ